MSKFQALAITTNYWKPNDDFSAAIINALQKRVANDDFVVVSEKAISTAQGNIIDESQVQAGLNAKLIAGFWMRFCWGYLFSSLLGFGPQLTRNLREYPFESGSRHKQVALEQAGFLQALMFGSEGAIDGSNLPYSYISVPLKNAQVIAEQIRQEIWNMLGNHVTVVIVDTDKTYTFRNFHFTPRPKPIQNIHSYGGVTAYILGRLLRLKKRPTPLAVAGQTLSVEETLRIANVADNARGTGSGTTVWKMAKHFNVNLTGVTWNMLSSITHKPIVIVRKKPTGKQ
jgi:F420-0:gamma-glutamyl ligase-like protein